MSPPAPVLSTLNVAQRLVSPLLPPFRLRCFFLPILHCPFSNNTNTSRSSTNNDNNDTDEDPPSQPPQHSPPRRSGYKPLPSKTSARMASPGTTRRRKASRRFSRSLYQNTGPPNKSPSLSPESSSSDGAEQMSVDSYAEAGLPRPPPGKVPVGASEKTKAAVKRKEEDAARGEGAGEEEEESDGSFEPDGEDGDEG